MPGLRYLEGVAMNSCRSGGTKSSCLLDARQWAGASSSRSREKASLPQNVPHVVAGSNQCSAKARGPEWLQHHKSRDDLRRATFLGATAELQTVSSSGSDNVDDLQAMVLDFMENETHENNTDPDPSTALAEKLQGLVEVRGAQERAVFAAVKRLLQAAGDVPCAKRFVVKHLRRASHDAAVCRSRWASSTHVPGGEYEYIAVVGGENHHRLIIDINFPAQFEIARPSSQYAAVLARLPGVFVGGAAQLEQVLRFMSDAARASLDQRGLHVPPWRTLDYMRCKWMSPSANAPSPLHSRTHQCADELLLRRSTKHSIFGETKPPNNLSHLPRARCISRANLLLI